MHLNRSGFTLIELLVAIVIGSVVVGALLQVIAGLGRFVELQSAREEVQQNSRAALELIGSELRAVPAGATLVQAESDAITLRAARMWGVVCAEPGLSSLSVTMPSVPGASFATNTGTGVVVNLGTVEESAWTNAVSVTAIGNALATCNGNVPPAGSEHRSVTLSSIPQHEGAEPQIGDVFYLYDQVTYRTGTSQSVPGLWIMRRAGDGTNQPMAGPIREGGGGLHFEYFAEASGSPLATPITDALVRESVTRVTVVVDAISRNRVGDEAESKADTVFVSLRNRL